MRRGDVPPAQRGGRIFMIAHTHNVRYFLLQIGPIEQLRCRAILEKSARRVVNRIATKNKKMLDSSSGGVGGKLQNALDTPIGWKFADDERAAKIFERNIHRVSEQLHDDRLVRTGQDETRARFRNEIVYHFRLPLMVKISPLCP